MTPGRDSLSVALSATIYNFQIELADADREVYQSLELRAARHPSESEEYFVTRVLAYALDTAKASRSHAASPIPKNRRSRFAI